MNDSIEDISEQYSNSFFIVIISMVKIYWKSILCFCLLGIIGAVVYLVVTPKTYISKAVLNPNATDMSSQMGGQNSQLSLLLAGNTDGASLNITILEQFKSRKFLSNFIKNNNLISIINPLKPDSKIAESEQLWYAVNFFKKNTFRVSQDAKSGLVTLFIEWTSPKIAYEWGTLLIKQVNEEAREKAIVDSNEKLIFLKSEAQNVKVMDTQIALASLIEDELRKLTMARTQSNFAYEIIDTPSHPPASSHNWPSKSLVLILGFIGGILAAMTFIILHLNFTKLMKN